MIEKPADLGYARVMEQFTILLIEDDSAVAKGIIIGLQDEGFAVIHAPSAEDGSVQLKTGRPHLIILDIRLPGENGFDFCRRIRSEGWKTPIIMLTARDEEIDKVLGLEVGADDYMVKPFSLRELSSRIRAQLRRVYGSLSAAAESSEIRFFNILIDTERLKVFKEDQEVLLTHLEYKLLLYLSEHEDIPLSREQILEAVWGFGEYYGENRTVDVHIRHLREKLEIDPSAPQMIHTVRGIGYKFNGEKR